MAWPIAEAEMGVFLGQLLGIPSSRPSPRFKRFVAQLRNERLSLRLPKKR
jgi:hypothetical protein